MDSKEKLIYFVTRNSHKFDEVLNLFSKERLNYNLYQSDIETIEIQAETIKEVALFKLNSVKQKIFNSFFIEDAGFFVDHPLKGFPGFYSSYVLKTIGNEGILKLIQDFDDSKAHFSAVIALYFKPLNKVFLFEGNVYGKVSNEIRGIKGFGFDPIFIPNSNPNNTFAELSTQEKNKISHRGQALEKLIDFLKKN